MGWITLGMKLLPYIVEAVGWVEKFVTRKGREKQDAAVYMVKSIVGVAEIADGRDLLDDEEVEDATRKVIDAVVALNNIVSKKRSE
tara:strand:- start:1415 stop:1672 length:258 start_codon:yes stop_codon:yes gene_type:complete